MVADNHQNLLASFRGAIVSPAPEPVESSHDGVVQDLPVEYSTVEQFIPYAESPQISPTSRKREMGSGRTGHIEKNFEDELLAIKEEEHG